MAINPPPGAPSREFAPRPDSATAARRFVREAVAGAAADAVDTAELLASELVTNALLHARTGIEVQAWATGTAVHVRIGDGRPDRALVPQLGHVYTSTGWGLSMVERLASRYGAEYDEGRKTVWFELWPDGPPPPSPGWHATTSPLCGPADNVTLVDLPCVLHAASQEHQNALLRELVLSTSVGDRWGIRAEDLATAYDINNAICACVTAALTQQPSPADVRSVHLSFPADATAAVLTLRRVLDAAERAARQADLLTRPALPQFRAFRDWLLDEITGQLAGEHPNAWTLVPREPSARPAELAAWQAGDVRTSRIPTIAADDANRIVAANEPVANLLGWPVEELIGRRLTALIPEHLRERHVASFSRLLLTGEPHILGRSVPLPALHRDGRLVPVRLFIQTQEAADGRTVFVAQLIPRTSAFMTSPSGAESAPATRHGREERPRPAETAPTGIAEPSEMPAPAWSSLLVDTTSALTTAPTLEEGLRRVGRRLTRQLAQWCAVDLLDEHHHVNRACVVHRRPQALTPAVYEGVLPPLTDAARGPLARVLRGAGPLLLTEIPWPAQATTALESRHFELFEVLQADSAVVAPLRVRRTILGALTLARVSGQPPFNVGDLAQVSDLVKGLALAVDNARLHQETQHIAERLQRSLLPDLPRSDHLQLAARYAPSSATAEVGGDWYDSFILPGGETVLVIGDVAGHDLTAAVTMGQLRNMLRGIAADRQEPPAEVLRRLDLANHTLGQEATATCIYGLIRGPARGPWELEYASAGHLPPLLTMPDGTTRYLQDGMGLLLGMDPCAARPSARVWVPPHATVLLYTDGLIERRDEPLDQTMSTLSRRTAALAREPLDTFCDELLIGLGADNADDIAILALRPTPLL
ncbi:SpoIIE family protein phosphatase [Streptomyces sp. NPDC047028]|uniref:SpoIIE family protein phosphatase n=1 Tax=Streptomyces sp. NPDC047028 TaxID=3155793 RepID=UPI0033D9D534